MLKALDPSFQTGTWTEKRGKGEPSHDYWGGGKTRSGSGGKVVPGHGIDMLSKEKLVKG